MRGGWGTRRACCTSLCAGAGPGAPDLGHLHDVRHYSLQLRVEEAELCHLYPGGATDGIHHDLHLRVPARMIDLMICCPTEFDFYLCSNVGVQDTTSSQYRPAQYHVLYDENYACCTPAVFMDDESTVMLLKHDVTSKIQCITKETSKFRLTVQIS